MIYHIEYYPIAHVSFGKHADGTSADKTYKGWSIDESYIPVPLDAVDEMGFDEGTLYMVDVDADNQVDAFKKADKLIVDYLNKDTENE